MATLAQEMFQGMADLYGKRRTYKHRSHIPYVVEDCAPPGCTWEFDYEWEQESSEDAPLVYVTTCRLMAHDGTEYPVKVASLDGRWVWHIEALISDEVAAENEAHWEARR
jgi:hypothetical protein